MYKIGTLNKISKSGLSIFDPAKYDISDDLSDSCGIIVRSYKMHEMSFSNSLMAIARAGAGVNNIPVDDCLEKGICVFNTPGANSNAVKELVLAGMLMAYRNLSDAVSWIKTLRGDISAEVEKGKSSFKGHELYGRTIGIIGLGAIGRKLANACSLLGMNVMGFDPFLSKQNAVQLPQNTYIANSIAEMVPNCDFISLHLPVNSDTKGLIDKSILSCMKPGTVLLNFARDTLVNEDDLIDSLESGIIKKYVVDFATEKLLLREDVISIPHLGASTTESEDNCARMAAMELINFLENGNTVNSVNFPNVDAGSMPANTRICILTKNEPDPLKLGLAMFADKKIISAKANIKGNFGYAVFDTDDEIISVPSVPEVIRVRILKKD